MSSVFGIVLILSVVVFLGFQVKGLINDFKKRKNKPKVDVKTTETQNIEKDN